MSSGDDSINYYFKPATTINYHDPREHDRQVQQQNKEQGEEQEDDDVDDEDLSLYKTAVFTKETPRDAIKTTLIVNNHSNCLNVASKPIRLSLTPPSYNFTNSMNNSSDNSLYMNSTNSSNSCSAVQLNATVSATNPADTTPSPITDTTITITTSTTTTTTTTNTNKKKLTNKNDNLNPNNKNKNACKYTHTHTHIYVCVFYALTLILISFLFFFV